MPIIRVELPNGRIIRLDIPKGATPAQIRDFVKSHIKEEALIAELLKRAPKPKDGESIKGDKGDSVKGDKGDSVKGDKGDSIKGDKGDAVKGKDGVSVVDIKINKKDELIITLSNGKKINAGKIPRIFIDQGNVTSSQLKGGKANLGDNKADILAFDGSNWQMLPAPPDPSYHIAYNPTVSYGLAWQKRGFSYLTDEAGAILTDEAGNALEGKDTIDARLLVNNDIAITELTFADTAAGVYNVLVSDERIYVDTTSGNIIINLILLAAAPRRAIHVQKTDVSSNTITITAGGSDTINGAGTKVISSQDVDHELVPASEWRLS